MLEMDVALVMMFTWGLLAGLLIGVLIMIMRRDRDEDLPELP